MKHGNLWKKGRTKVTHRYSLASATPATSEPSLHNYALCGPNNNSYSTGPGKVINDGECGCRENQMAATW